MTNQYLVTYQNVQLETGQTIQLEYLLTEETSEVTHNSLYGIKINKIFGEDCESESTGAISYKKDLVLQMIQDFSYHQVTPISIIEIVDDIITERECL